MFTLHPTLINSTLRLFQWVDLGEDESRTMLDLEIECWSGIHFAWSLGLGIPMFFIWVIGMPLFALAILTKNRTRLDHFSFQKYFIILYQGLKRKHYYWEFTNTARKFLLVSINVFISQSDIEYKALFAVTILIIVNRIENVLKPYKLQIFNELETREIFASIITLYAGILFLREESDTKIFSIFAFILIVYLNWRFYILWKFAIAKILEKKSNIAK
jgi:hypothetical protein